MPAPRLPRPALLLIAGTAVSSLGTGLVLPLTLIYLHQVRGIPLALVGALLALGGAAGLVTVPLTGLAIDRFGARRVLAAVLAGQAVAQASLAWAVSVPTAAVSVLLLGMTTGPGFPAASALMAALVPEAARQQRAFAVNFTGINAGIGVGGAVGAAVADVSSPASFQSLYLANAISCLAFAALVATLPDARARREPGTPAARYREVLAEPWLRTVIIATLVLAFTGYAAMDAGLPAFASVEAHVSVHVVALSITVNTAVIVAAQLPVLRLVRALRRSRALVAVGLIWAAAWAVFGLSALPAGPGWRTGCVLAYAGLFGLGETFLAPTVSPLVNLLAGERVRGRANALSSLTYSVAFVVSPAISTGLIAAGLAAAWIAALSAGCLVTVALGLSLGRRLSPGQDRVAARPPAREAVAAAP